MLVLRVFIGCRSSLSAVGLLTGATMLQAFWQEQMVDLQSVVAFLQ